MAGLVDFLRDLLDHGKVLFQEKPFITEEERPAAAAVLRRAYETYRLAVAGPPLDFHEPVALAAGELVRQACWFLVHRGEPAEELERVLKMPDPQTPADHLSVDLIFRFLPQVHRRAHHLAPDDPLAGLLAGLLRQWPLTGVLSEVPEPPLSPLDFDGHPGLQLLYAERLAETEKPDWLPQGRAFEYLEMVYRDRGQPHAPFLRKGSG